MSARNWTATFVPWLGLVAGAVGWGASHQVGSDVIFDDCSRGGAFVLLVCLIALAVTAIGGAISFMARGGGGETRRFIALVSTLLAALAGFAILLQIAAGLILPACAA
jgi:uncharacterized membrane protein